MLLELQGLMNIPSFGLLVPLGNGYHNAHLYRKGSWGYYLGRGFILTLGLQKSTQVFSCQAALSYPRALSTLNTSWRNQRATATFPSLVLSFPVCPCSHPQLQAQQQVLTIAAGLAASIHAGIL